MKQTCMMECIFSDAQLIKCCDECNDNKDCEKYNKLSTERDKLEEAIIDRIHYYRFYCSERGMD